MPSHDPLRGHRLRILFTNIRLGMRTGTEIIVRDFALRLSERGHEVAVYSPSIGPLADELRGQGIPVVDNLLEIDRSPDVIHGHHMPATAEAILAFPHTPAIWVCHDSTSWYDRPPRFQQVRRLFAVDETCRARLINVEHVPAEEIGILPNAVDLRRCIGRPAVLPVKPRRAISLVKHSGLTDILREACDHFGLLFQAYGHGVGRPVDNIEELCVEADIVFATARTALEAMATGAAVVLVDGRGFGGLVTSATYEQGRRFNFGLGMLTRETTASGLIEAIASYDAADAATVSRRARQEADLDLTVARLEDVYRLVIDEAANDSTLDAETLRRERVEFCRSWLPHLEPSQQWLWDRQRLLEQQKAKIDSLVADVARMDRSRAVRLAKFIRRQLGLLR